jgi:hypothetical protein
VLAYHLNFSLKDSELLSMAYCLGAVYGVTILEDSSFEEQCSYVPAIADACKKLYTYGLEDKMKGGEDFSKFVFTIFRQVTKGLKSVKLYPIEDYDHPHGQFY